MIALFVITEAREPAPAPTRTSASASAWSRARRVCSSSASVALRLISCTRPSASPFPYQKSVSTFWNVPGAIPRSRCSGPSSKTP